MDSKRWLAWCPEHAFVTFTELKNVTYLPIASCGHVVFGVTTIRTLKQAIQIVDRIRHATWHKDISLSKDLKIHIVGYKDHFRWLRMVKEKINLILYNLRLLTQER